VVADEGANRKAQNEIPAEANLLYLQEDFNMFGRPKEVGKTWVEEGGELYGARPDELGPIGGGSGYAAVVTGGDFRVSTLEGLLEALEKAGDGQVVFVDGNAEIDCTTRVYIEKLVIEIPEGVTLAGDRGQNGSRGAMIRSDAFATRPLIRAVGPNVRITGLRIRGPNPKRHLEHHRRSFSEGRGHEYYYKFPVSDGIMCEHPGLEVDNCEIAGWSHAGVFLQGGEGHRIHHNFIHHNQYQGLGYGICHDEAVSRIDHNLFDFNRHSIAGTGRPGTSYEAANNVELGDSLSHCFDMHGGRDRGDGTDIAGTWIRIHHNTFRAPQTPIVIRGTPEEECRVYRNWFLKHTPPGGENPAVRSGKNTVVEDNRYGE
jgi:hypothetical protein